mgnify:CR=1 FL=1
MAAEASDSSAAAATAGASSDSPQSTKPIAANGWPLYPEPYTQMEQIGQVGCCWHRQLATLERHRAKLCRELSLALFVLIAQRTVKTVPSKSSPWSV